MVKGIRKWASHFKTLMKKGNKSATASRVNCTEHNIKWDHFNTLLLHRAILNIIVKLRKDQQESKLTLTANDSSVRS